jgi:DNA polymerase III delta prime subunit
MDQIDLDNILNRDNYKDQLRDIIYDIIHSNDITIKRGIFFYGDSGIGKTTFILNLLKQLDYDVIYYDGSDLRNKVAIENIADNNISNYNVSKLLSGEKKRIIIVMDDVESMNTGDKGGINSLAKLIRPKKTKKQKKELKSTNPIICISNLHVDKKIKEIMKVCHIIELNKPTNNQIYNIYTKLSNPFDKQNIDTLNNINGDLRKLQLILGCKNKSFYFQKQLMEHYDVKIIVSKLYLHRFYLSDHNNIINETDRTIIGLIYHENIISILQKLPFFDATILYTKILETMAYADYLDRITFQKQIWQFNEISSLLKTMNSNLILHEHLNNNTISTKKNINTVNTINFTKVLTKYSTEYNNHNFCQQLCFKLSMDNNEVLVYFKSIRNDIDDYYEYFTTFDISRVEISRLYRYIDSIENITELS